MLQHPTLPHKQKITHNLQVRTIGMPVRAVPGDCSGSIIQLVLCDIITDSYGQVRSNDMKAADMLIFVDYTDKTDHGGH